MAFIPRTISFLLAVACVAFTHCGYRLKVPVNEVFTSAKGISVITFDNWSEEVGAERVFTNALVREIQNREEIKLSDPESSDAQLKGTIVSIQVTPTASSALGFKGLQPYRRIPTEIGARVVLDLKLVERITDKILWTKRFEGFRRVNAPVTRTYNYQAPSSLGLQTQSLYESMFPELARDIMREVYDEMMENF